MRSDPGVAAAMFEALAEAGINIEHHLDVVDPDLLRRPRLEIERAVQVVHDRFKLHEPVVSAEA